MSVIPSNRSHQEYFKKAEVIPSEKITPDMRFEDQAFKDPEDDLKFQIDIQVSPKKMVIVKIYKGDKAEDILNNLKRHRTLALQEEELARIEKVVRYHTDLN